MPNLVNPYSLGPPPSVPTAGLINQYDATNPTADGILPTDGSPLDAWISIVPPDAFSIGQPAWRPLWVASGTNGKNSVRFDGIEDFYGTANQLDISTTFSIFIVCSTSSTTSAIFATSSGTSEPFITANDGSDFAWKNDTETATFSSSGATGLNILGLLRDNSGGANSLVGYFNGTQVFSTAATVSTSGLSFNWMAGDNFGTNLFGGDLCEVLFYDRIVTSGEVGIINSILSSKWGI